MQCSSFRLPTWFLAPFHAMCILNSPDKLMHGST